MDMLVRLYDLPDPSDAYRRMDESGIEVRRPYQFERAAVLNWVKEHFSVGWQGECSGAFSSSPVSAFVAVKDGKMLGFGVYDVTQKGYFGPLGVDEALRGCGIGAAITLKCMYALREDGYTYGIIGGVGPADFYSKVLGAVPIEGSDPGIYKNIIQ